MRGKSGEKREHFTIGSRNKFFLFIESRIFFITQFEHCTLLMINKSWILSV